jgi:hypothetical protein
MKLSDLKVARESITADGVWMDGVPLPGLAVKVRSTLNPDYQALRVRLVNAVPPFRRQDGLSPADQFEIETKCIAQTLLVDWRGFTDDDGAPMPMPQGADLEALLADPEFAILRLAVLQAAQNASLVRTQQREADEKNSSTRSTGRSSGARGVNGSTMKPGKAASAQP